MREAVRRVIWDETEDEEALLAKARRWRDLPDLPDRAMGGRDWDGPAYADTG